MTFLKKISVIGEILIRVIIMTIASIILFATFVVIFFRDIIIDAVRALFKKEKGE